MKVFARKELQTLSLTAPFAGVAHKNSMDSRPAKGTEFPETRRLRIIQPEPKWPRLSPKDIRRKLASVSQVDVMRVNWATIREGESHCIWPHDVIEKFSAADVISEKSTSHYVLREVNVTRLK